MYLRLGWIVGTVGLATTLVIIILAHVATITTGLALSSMTTNVRIGAGGFYLAASNLINSATAGISPVLGGKFADFFAGR